MEIKNIYKINYNIYSNPKYKQPQIRKICKRLKSLIFNDN